MKKLYFLAATLFMGGALVAQTNLDLEQWSAGEPVDWLYDFGDGLEPGTLNYVTGFGLPATTTEETAAPAGGTGSSARIENLDATAAGAGILGGILLGQWAYTAEPTDFNFDVKIELETGDTALVYMELLDASDVAVGFTGGFFTVADNTTGWVSLSLPVNYVTANPVASLVVYATSSYADNSIMGSTIWVDNFELVTSNVSISLNEIASNAYPNPASDVLNISITEPMSSITVVGMDGRTVIATSVSGTETTVDVSKLVPGVYYYTVATENGNVTRNSFVKK
jgi:hypothetical protein